MVSVSLDGQTLNVTMNNRFLTSTPVVMSDGTVSESAAEQTAMKNRLALYAVVNSLAELDPFIQVQILVDKDNDGKRHKAYPVRGRADGYGRKLRFRAVGEKQ